MAARVPQGVPTKGNKCMITMQAAVPGSDKQLIKTKLANKFGLLTKTWLFPEGAVARTYYCISTTWKLTHSMRVDFLSSLLLPLFWEQCHYHSLLIAFLSSSSSAQFTFNQDFQEIRSVHALFLQWNLLFKKGKKQALIQTSVSIGTHTP